jgi:hypothetical protein
MRKSWHHRYCPAEVPIMDGWDRLGWFYIGVITLPSLIAISQRSHLSELSLLDD